MRAPKELVISIFVLRPNICSAYLITSIYPEAIYNGYGCHRPGY